MSELTINDVKYTNIPNKKAGVKIGNRLTQSNIKLQSSTNDYILSEDFYNLVNAIDIDWNGIEIEDNKIINTTSDLIKYLKQK